MLALLERPRNRWLLLLAIWPLASAAVATQEYVYRAGFNLPISWLDALRYPAIEYFFWLSLLQPVWAVAMRFRIERTHWLRNAGAILLCFLVVDILHGIYRGALHGVVYPHHLAPDFWHPPPVPALIRWYAVGNLFGDLYRFITIAALAHLVHYYRSDQRRERDLATTRLEVLETQLQPHFLFNALNSIATLMHEDVEAADDMMTKLAALLRRTLDRGDACEIPLREEVELLRLYLDIQQTRFQDRLTTAIDVPPETEDALVPRLILQPLAENAVRHGISANAGSGRIEVHARRENGRLHLSVTDDGPGLLREIPAGVGLANTRARLAHHYNGGHSFDLRNRAEGGVIAEIDLPYRSR